MSRAKTMKNLIKIVLLLGFVHLAIADNNGGNNSGNRNDDKGSKDLPKGNPASWVDVIVQLKSPTGKYGSNDLQNLLKFFQDQSDDEDRKNGRQGSNGRHD